MVVVAICFGVRFWRQARGFSVTGGVFSSSVCCRMLSRSSVLLIVALPEEHVFKLCWCLLVKSAYLTTWRRPQSLQCGFNRMPSGIAVLYISKLQKFIQGFHYKQMTDLQVDDADISSPSIHHFLMQFVCHLELTWRVCVCVCFSCRETERAGQEGLTEEQQHCRKSRQPAAQEEQRHGQNTVGSQRCGLHFHLLSFAGVVLIGDSSSDVFLF